MEERQIVLVEVCMKRLIKTLGLSETASIMCSAIGILFVILLFAGLLFIEFIYPLERPLAYTSGLVVGCLLSVVKTILLEKALERSADMGRGSGGYAVLMYVVRYFLTLCVLAFAVFFREKIGPFGVIIGILSLQGAAYIAGNTIKKRDASYRESA